MYIWQKVGLIIAIASISLVAAGNCQETSSPTCDRYIKKADSTHKQAQLELTSVKNQWTQAQQKLKQTQELFEAGAAPKNELELARQKLQQTRKEVEKAIATAKEAQNQWRSLKNMSACAL